MNAHKLWQEDNDNNDLTFPSKTPAYVHKRQAKSSVLEAQLTKSDVEVVRRSLGSLKARNERIEALKTQVNAGAYQIDCTLLAQKMSEAHDIQKTLGVGRHSIIDYE